MARSISAGTVTIAIVAILAGLVGAYALRTALMEQETAPEQEPPERLSVPVASADLPQGRALSRGDMAILNLTRDQMRERGMPLDKTLLSTDMILGRRLKEPIEQGEPFLTTAFYLEGEGPDPTENLKPGYRAVSVQVPEVRGGWVEPGMWVDVIFRLVDEQRRDERELPEKTVSLISGVEVLSVTRPEVTRLQAVVGYVSQDPRITLAVTPRQAMALRTVEGYGELSLVPGSQQDAVASLPPDTGQELTLEELLGIEPPPEPAQPFITEVYYRGRRNLNVFDRSGRRATRRSQTRNFISEPTHPPANDDGDGVTDRPVLPPADSNDEAADQPTP